MEGRKVEVDTAHFVARVKELGIENVMRVGPPDNEGFMWWKRTHLRDGTAMSEAQKDNLEILKHEVLDRQWDSSGYGWMMRSIQNKLNNP